MCWEAVPGFFCFSLIYIVFSKIMSDSLLYLLSLPHLALTSKRFVKWVKALKNWAVERKSEAVGGEKCV